MGYRDITLVPAGLADSDTVLKLHLLPGRRADSAATVIQSLRPHETFDTIWVPCFRLDALREALAVGAIALIKIDVEGAELEVLRGMAETIGKDTGSPMAILLRSFSMPTSTLMRGHIFQSEQAHFGISFGRWATPFGIYAKRPLGPSTDSEMTSAFPFKTLDP